jgi:hypothetical protein
MPDHFSHAALGYSLAIPHMYTGPQGGVSPLCGTDQTVELLKDRI